MPELERPDVHDPDQSSAGDERHAEHRPDAFLAEDRVHDVGAIEVFDLDRRDLGGDAAGKSLADRDADAALDLLLEAFRRARYELRAGVVEQEHRARVGVERVAHTGEQLVEQLVELEMRKCRIGDLLELPQRTGGRRGRSLGPGRAHEHSLVLPRDE